MMRVGIVIAGDFNTDSSGLHKIMSKHGLEETSIPRYISTSTYLCESPRIDHLFLKNLKASRFRIWNAESHLSFSNCMRLTIEKLGSDHYPVEIEIEK